MAAEILDGKALAQELQREIRDDVARFVQYGGADPCLAAVLVGDDPASEIYVRNKRRACERVGIKSRLERMSAEIGTDELLDRVNRLNRDTAVHGILVQLPLPSQVDTTAVLDSVDPFKDVDAFHPENVGLLVQGRPRFLPCTPHGIQQLLIHSGIETTGRHVVVLGRSDIVGKPMAIMLAQRSDGANATVTICHSRTANLPEMTKQADILIVAIGKARFVTAEMVKAGAAVIDVGMNRADGRLVGDVDFDAVKKIAGHITPVPGGVGPLTITMLLRNTLTAARLRS